MTAVRCTPVSVAVLTSAVLAQAAPARALRAQQVDSLRAGARVRVALGPRGRAVEATYLGADSAGLRVATRAPGTYAWRDVRRVERYAGRVPAGEAFGRGAARGALVGAGLSAAALAIVTYSELRHPPADRFVITATAVAGVLYTGAFAVVGGALGLGHPQRDRWAPVQLRP